VGGGFSVDAGKLSAGSQDMNGLRDRCETIAGDAVGALSGMAGAAGHPGLASALSGAAGDGARTFFMIGSAYGHAGTSLTTTAQNYTNSNQSVIGNLNGFLHLEA
jgi:hypothetical protein